MRVEDPETVSLSVRPVARPARRPADEVALLAAVGERIARPSGGHRWTPPPITHLASVALSLAATAPEILRSPGRPLSQVLGEAGLEVHLGWVGPRGTDWTSLTVEEVSALEDDVASLLADERTDEAALCQERLVLVLRRHDPAALAPARRRLARILCRAGRPRDALAELSAAFGDDDPEDWYEAAVIARRLGDEVRARRWVESGLARSEPDRVSDPVAECLADIAGDLDAQAALRRLEPGLADLLPDAEGAHLVARGVASLGRSYLLEAFAEAVLARLPEGGLAHLARRLTAEEGGGEARAVLTLIARPTDPEAVRASRRAAAGLPRESPVAGLLGAHPREAWATSPSDAPDQRQVVITIAKECGRVCPLVVLLDIGELGGGVKDAFFLPDMVMPRLGRELLTPMADAGLPAAGMDVTEAVALVRDALEVTRERGWQIPSLRHQPVLERIDRWLPRPHGGGARRRALPGG